MKIRPLHDRLLVERLAEKEVKKGGIIIPDTLSGVPAASSFSRAIARGSCAQWPCSALHGDAGAKDL